MTSRRVPVVRPESRHSIDRWADAFLGQHYPHLLERPGLLPVDHLIDVILPRHYGVDSGIDTLPPGVEGVTEPPNRITIRDSAYDGIIAGNPRDRFTGAHEATHAVRHLHQINQRFESTGGVRLHRRSEVPVYADPEWQANRGAAALLMPARVIARMTLAGKVAAPDVARLFGVSMQAAEYRLDDAAAGRMWMPS